MSSSQYHWMTAASSREVGVSALYSSSFGGSTPFHERSKRPYSDGGSASQERSIRGPAWGGIASSAKSLFSMMCPAALSAMAASSLVALSRSSTSFAVNSLNADSFQ